DRALPHRHSRARCCRRRERLAPGPGAAVRSGAPAPCRPGAALPAALSVTVCFPSPAPIATSSTIFQRGFERALRRQNKEQVPPAAAPEPPPRKQHTGKSGKKAPGSDAGAQPGRCRSLEEAVKALDLADLQKELQKSRSVFPENPSVWVKDLAGYLNYKLQAPRSDPVLSQHPHDYPYCLVSKELRSIIRSLLAKATDVLELFFDHCIYTMLQELDKAQGESLHGYRICIQALLLYRPRIATTNLGKYLEVLRSHQNRPAKCLTVLWALGQAGFTDLHEGLKVWLGVMLPVLGIKSLSPYAVSYLDRLLLMHPNLTKGFGMIGPKDFFPLLDFAFMPNNSLSPSLQEQLRRLYPRLKVLALGARPEAALHTYFPSFLSRATPACPPAMKEELLTSLSQCLSLDPLSFSVWRQLYTKHLAQSSLLLNHLLESWESSSKKVQQSLQETVRSFKVTNEELAARGDMDVAACDTACKVRDRVGWAGTAWQQPWPDLSSVLGPRDMPNNSLSPSLQEQLRRLYPRLKVLALGARPEAALHTYFPSFLSRATPACPPAMKEELLTSLSQCLSLDPLSFSVWRQLYTKHLAQSSLLLNHLLESWESSSKKVQQSLQETVRSFKVTNEELAARGDMDVAACDTACKELLCKMKGRGFPWSRLLLVLLLCAAAFVLHDVQTHGSFQASSCARLLRSSGVLPASQLAWQKVSRACLQGYRWLEHSLAQHGSVALSVLWPQLELLWKTSAEVARAVTQQGCSLLSWLHGSLPWLSNWLQSRLPEALLHLAECARELLLFVLHSCLLPLLQGLAAVLQRGWQSCLDSCSGDVTWECVRDHLMSFTYSSWIYLQNATLALKNWALAMISGH
ncbi:transmembrane protein 214, partial [Pyrgilauda ruficollis]|uniref:transmembrane protein 214 n=1 Tax=Pyrgilauda ruficollis TaxID=221976 RepID=UPI001B85FBD9